MKVRLSSTFYQRLTVLNAVLLVALLAMSLYAWGAATRPWWGVDYFSTVAQSSFKKALSSSKAVSQTASLLSGEPLPKELPVFHLDIKSDTLREIELLARKITDIGVMEKHNKIWFPARFTAEGKSYKIKIRLRGDMSAHFSQPKKSYRIKFRGGDRFHGYKSLNLLIPRDMEYEAEPAIYRIAKKLGLISPDAGFARVFINRVDMGAYLWFEQMGKEMLERHGFPGGELFTGSDTRLDNARTVVGAPLTGRNKHFAPSYYKGEIHAGTPTGGIIQQRFHQLLALAASGDDARVRRELSHYVDLEKTAAASALAYLVGGTHGLSLEDLTWFYDPTTGKFQPALYDVTLAPIYVYEGEKLKLIGGTAFDHSEAPSLWSVLMQPPEVTRRRNEILLRMTEKEGPELLEIMQGLYRDLRASLGAGVAAKDLHEMDQRHEERLIWLRNNIRLYKNILGFGRVFIETDLRQERDGVRLLSTLYPESLGPLSLRKVRLLPFTAFPDGVTAQAWITGPDGKRRLLTPDRIAVPRRGVTMTFPDLEIWTERERNLLPRETPWRFELLLHGLPPEKAVQSAYPADYLFTFTSSLTGEPLLAHRVRHPPVRIAPTAAAVPERAAFLADPPLPFRLLGDDLILGRGVHRVTRDLILPRDLGLILEAGATLNMAPGTSILAFRRIDVRGTKPAPVTVQPAVPGQPWGVFGVTGAARASTVRHLHLRGGSEKWLAGIFFSGQLNFYGADVDIMNSLITGAAADDGLNIKNARFSLSGTVIRDNSSDGFDGDWVEGSIRGSTFRDNGGDGIDFSGSQVVVADTLLTGMGDKGVSAGEKTAITLFNALIEGSDMGIAAKDKSTARVFASTLRDNRIGLALYRKKPLFERGGSGEMVGGLLTGNRENLQLDTLSSITLKGVAMDQAPTAEGIASEDLRISQLSGNGPVTAPETLLGVTIPDLSQGGQGLFRPLTAGR